MASNRVFNKLEGTLTTTDATVTTIITVPTTTGKSYMMRMMGVSRNTANTNTKAWDVIQSGKNVAGAFSGAGLISNSSLMNDEATTLSMVGSSSNLLIQVTGIAATTIDWHVCVEWIEN